MAEDSKKKKIIFPERSRIFSGGFNSFFKKLELATPVNREGIILSNDRQ